MRRLIVSSEMPSPKSSFSRCSLPQSAGGLTPGGWWNVLANRAEDLADEALGCPVRQADLAARPADPQQLLGGLLLVGRKHHAKDREHHIE